MAIKLVIEAFERLGGRAILKTHFAMVERLCSERGTACPTEENVRITIYNHTPGRKNYLGGHAFFEVVGRGEYRLLRPSLDQL
jgi:hypothetical protein